LFLQQKKKRIIRQKKYYCFISSVILFSKKKEKEKTTTYIKDVCIMEKEIITIAEHRSGVLTGNMSADEREMCNHRSIAYLLRIKI
jgi:hypothetical protein